MALFIVQHFVSVWAGCALPVVKLSDVGGDNEEGQLLVLRVAAVGGGRGAHGSEAFQPENRHVK